MIFTLRIKSMYPLTITKIICQYGSSPAVIITNMTPHIPPKLTTHLDLGHGGITAIQTFVFSLQILIRNNLITSLESTMLRNISLVLTCKHIYVHTSETLDILCMHTIYYVIYIYKYYYVIYINTSA